MYPYKQKRLFYFVIVKAGGFEVPSGKQPLSWWLGFQGNEAVLTSMLMEAHESAGVPPHAGAQTSFLVVTNGCSL
jgi:hypothetical protein